jgi:hypothetical protein
MGRIVGRAGGAEHRAAPRFVVDARRRFVVVRLQRPLGSAKAASRLFIMLIVRRRDAATRVANLGHYIALPARLTSRTFPRKELSMHAAIDAPQDGSLMNVLNRMIFLLPRIFIPLFALLFLVISVAFAVLAMIDFVAPFFNGENLLDGLVQGLHTGVVALAVYELAQIVHQEYEHEGKPQNVMARIRRGVARFGSVVIVALVLESLIMVIKYSQKDLAGFLFYPAAIIVAAASLLAALGLFTRLTALPVRAARD